MAAPVAAIVHRELGRRVAWHGLTVIDVNDRR